MTGLRERKKRKTFAAIHEAAMRLFAEHGYNAVTVADIAQAAEVSRATVFAYFPAKEHIVLGDAPMVVAELEARLEARPENVTVISTVRDWLRLLVGWVEPDLLLQRRLADEIHAVAAARSRLLRDVESVIAAALARELGDESALAPRLVAGSLTAALAAAEHEAAERMGRNGEPLTATEIDALLDDAVAFVDGGLARLRKPRSRT